MSVTAAALAELIGAELVGDGSLPLDGVAKIEDAGERKVTFIANRNYLKYLPETGAGAVILASIPEGEEGRRSYLVTDDPYAGFVKVLRHFHPEPAKPEPGVHPSAVVAGDAVIAESASVGPLSVVESGAAIGERTVLLAHCYVGRDANIGADCFLHTRVTVRERCEIGSRVVIQDSAVIGSDGFGYAPGEEGYAKIPQVGNVVLEDDVEIGANTTIDRATLGCTIIRRGVKLDNLIQIAHNVDVGEDTVMAAQVGVAGSSTIGRRSMFGGQVGISGHIRLSDGVMIAAQSGVHKDFGPDRILGGYPAVEIREWRKNEAAIRQLPDLIKRVRKLEGGK
ncbi:MAG: UDP-3-O-acylglucosamine N-acyltransferase [Calditrichaeota bacterium]|nr:UDP-3-O-acylglucosamine N-acyltransferase [Calditrichota bacterium]